MSENTSVNKEIRLAYPQDLIQKLGDYLISRPYAEVAHLVPRLQLEGVQVEIDIAAAESSTPPDEAGKTTDTTDKE